MQANTALKTNIDNLVCLPSFARFLRDHKLEEWVDTQLHLSTEVQLPLLRFFSELPKEELKKIFRQSAIDMLDALANNKAQKHIDQTLKKYQDNLLPVVTREDVAAEDINLSVFVRRQTFLHFITDFTSDTEKLVEILREIDLYLLQFQAQITQLYIQILKNSINENAHFIEKITHTSPGLIYVFDMVAKKLVYINKPLAIFLGYEDEKINANQPEDYVYPDDLEFLERHNNEFDKTVDNEIKSIRVRLKNGKGEYRWMRSFETVFKRNSDGQVIEKIGISIDVHDQKVMSEKLEKREAELLEAQEIARIGSFTWNVNGGPEGSPQLKAILGIDFNDQQVFFNKIHEEDLARVKQAFDQAQTTGAFECEFRFKGNSEEKILWMRGIMHYKEDAPLYLNGTIMDITEKQILIQQLRHQEKIYQRIEELANMGNWTWDLKKNALQWSDNLYRIYGIDPAEEQITIDKFLSFIHPEDLDMVRNGVQSISEVTTSDQNFRIRSRSGQEKFIRSIAQVEKNEQGEPVSVIGTERDVTEKYSLVHSLRQSENLYKQAQALAHVGNWTWDVMSNEIFWSDEVYRIFGLNPEHNINFDRYIERIHPEDVALVTETISASGKSGQPWEFTHRVITGNGELKYVYGTGEVIRNEAGEVVKMMGTSQDVTERQLLIERLQKSEQLYKQAQALARIGNWTWEMDTDTVEWSDEVYTIYELDPSEKITYDVVTEFIHPEDKTEVLNYLAECIREKKIYDKRHRIVLRNGREKVVHRRAEIVKANGKPDKLVGTTQEVTEIEQVQQELNENQNFIRKITDATPSIITTYNVHSGAFVFINEGLEKLLGYKTGEAMEKGLKFFIDIIHPEDLQDMMEKTNKALEEANANPHLKELIIEFSFRIKHKKDGFRWYNTYGTIFDRNAQGKVEHVLNIALDITEQKTAIQKIKEQEHFIQQIADASPTILYLYDVEKQSIVYINREIFFVLGHHPDEIIKAGNKVTSMLYHPEDYHLLPARSESQKNFSQVDSMIQYECRVKSKDGEYRWFLVREIVFKSDSEGNICQILGAALDINRRKEMEKTILQNTLLLEQSNSSLEEFAYVASHDLKEPLRKISTFGDRLAASQLEILSPDGKIYLNKILDASNRMQTMISDLLSISMITGNRSFEKFSLQQILDDTIQTLEYKIEQQNAVIRHDLLPEAQIIPSQFRQLFQNLLSNSLKFVQPGVQPVISITHSFLKEKDIVHYQLSPADTYSKIVFSDNGIGFENEFAGKIFAIFQRLHGRSEYEGSGIGLAICKKIVEHHGGVIYAEGSLDTGATFTIILPYD